MTIGLQIWNKKFGSTPSINITDRCTSIVGTLELGIWMWGYDKYDIFNWKKITVPELSYGEPFWSFKNNAHNKIMELVRKGEISKDFLDPYYWYSSYLNIEPEIYVNGNDLYYRYPPDSTWTPGDYLSWYVGGHIMFYGVC